MKKTISFSAILLGFLVALYSHTQVYAQPYGAGIYNIDVPYGNQTSLSISTSGNVSIPITPTTSGTLATGTNNVTVTSTDVSGFKLYVRALNDTSMTNLGATLPASLNSSPAPLSINTWGYNIDASSNFSGLALTDTLLKSLTAPAKSGNITTITYGILLDLAKPAGNYSVTVIYTAVPQTT